MASYGYNKAPEMGEKYAHSYEYNGADISADQPFDVVYTHGGNGMKFNFNFWFEFELEPGMPGYGAQEGYYEEMGKYGESQSSYDASNAYSSMPEAVDSKGDENLKETEFFAYFTVRSLGALFCIKILYFAR